MPIDNALLLRLKLDEGTGTTLSDSSGNGRHFSASGATWLTGQAVPGGKALSFDGVNDYAASDANVNLGQSSVSICFWAYVTTAQDAIICELSPDFNATTHAWMLTWDASTIWGVIKGMSGYREETRAMVAAGAWRHFVFLLNNSTAAGDVKLWIDGVEQTLTLSTNSKAGTANFATARIFLGARSTSAQYPFAGRIADFRIYQGELTTGEIEEVIAGDSIAGAGAVTQGVQTVAASGTSTNPDYGAVTQGAQTASAAGTVTPPEVLSYVDEVLADEPIAYWRLNETAPSGANSVVDLSGNGRHITPPGSGASWGQNGALADGSGKSVRLDGTARLQGPNGVATEMFDGPWTVEAWFMPTGTADGIILAASNGSSAITVMRYANQVRVVATGIAGAVSSPAIPAWNHIVVTSAGLVYLNGVAQGGSDSGGLNTTLGFAIGGSNGTGWLFNSRIAEVAVYGSALSAGRITAHWEAGIRWTVPSGRTFLWGMESDLPEQVPPGSDDQPLYFAASSRSTAQAFAGSYSLACASNWAAATFDNPSPAHRWMPTSEGAVRFRFRFTGSVPGGQGLMLFQITGKDIALVDDTNDGIACRYTSAGISFQNITAAVFPAADTWHEIICRYRLSEAGTPTQELRVNGTVYTSNAAVDLPECVSWHHLLIGNDHDTIPAGLWIDEFETFGSWAGVDAGAAGAGAATQGAQSAAGAGGATIPGACAVTQGVQSASATGAQAIAGAGTIPQAAQSASGAGAEVIAGAATPSQSPQTTASVGVEMIAGTCAGAQSAQTAAAAGSEITAGAGAANQSAQTASGAGTITSTGNVGTVTQAPQIATGAGAQTIAGSGGATQGAQSAASSGTIRLSGAGAVLQAPQAATASAALSLTATVTVVQGVQLSSGIARVVFSGSAAVSQSAQTATGAADTEGPDYTPAVRLIGSIEDLRLIGAIEAD